MERKLASVQRIRSIEPIDGADFIERVQVLGWFCVARKGEFQVGDLCVYYEIDSILPERDVYEFMRPKRFKVKTAKFKGQISQGLALPVDMVGLNISYLTEGEDVTKQLGVYKYEPGMPTHLQGRQKGTLPHFVKKTDETRIQSCPSLIHEMEGLEVYQSVKLDGASMSIYFNSFIDEPFGVCSRNINLSEDEENAYWRVAHKYNLKEKLTDWGVNVVIQGEICGPGIQGNKLGLKDLDLYIFNVFYLDRGKYGDKEDIELVCKGLGLKMVPVEDIYIFGDETVESLLKKAEGKYYGTKNPREGIVIRPVISRLSPRIGYSLLSFKVVSNTYLLKEKDIDD